MMFGSAACWPRTGTDAVPAPAAIARSKSRLVIWCSTFDSFFFFRYPSVVYFQANSSQCQFPDNPSMKRRDLLKGAAVLPVIGVRADVPPHLWQGFDFGSGRAV